MTQVTQDQVEYTLNRLGMLSGRWSRFFPSEIKSLAASPSAALAEWYEQGQTLINETESNPITFQVARCGEHLAKARTLIRMDQLAKEKRRG